MGHVNEVNRLFRLSKKTTIQIISEKSESVNKNVCMYCNLRGWGHKNKYAMIVARSLPNQLCVQQQYELVLNSVDIIR